MLKKLATSLAPIALALSLSSVIPVAQAAPASNNAQLFQQTMQEERAWAGLTTRTLKVGDVEWSYSEGGDKSKPTVLLVHGLSGTRDNWNRVAHYLTPYYHVVIPDLPAHGDTKVPAEFDLQVPNLTEHCAALPKQPALTKT